MTTNGYPAINGTFSMASGSAEIANVQRAPGLSSLGGAGSRRPSAIHAKAASS